jgi:hypothetical protein
MSEPDRLIELTRALPAEKVHALLTVAEPLDVDEETAKELRAARSEGGKTISHKELKRELALE